MVGKEWQGYEDLESYAISVNNWSEVEDIIVNHFRPVAKQLDLFAVAC
jgi:hypothetical protein